jgi:hypothetical protein
MRLQDAPKTDGVGPLPGYFYKTVGGTDSFGVFSFTRLIDPSREDFSEVAEENRCDTTLTVGPQGFHEWDVENNVCSCGSSSKPYKLTGHHHVTFPQLKMLAEVIDARPYTIIMYMELKNPADEVATIEGLHTEHCRTLQELFRLMYEWKYAHDRLGSREPMATTCAGAINILDIPTEIEQWLTSEMPSEKVGRYLTGSESARVRNTNIPDIPDFFSEWLHEKISTTRQTSIYG